MFNPVDIVQQFYREGTSLYDLTLRHGEDVARKAVTIARRLDPLQPDIEFIDEVLRSIASYGQEKVIVFQNWMQIFGP